MRCLIAYCLSCALQGTKLRCLVPPFLASSCPNLAQLKIVQPDFGIHQLITNEAELQLPLIPCNRIKQLHLDTVLSEEDTEDGPSQGATIQRQPTVYHTIAELRNNLRNIDTLIMRTPIPALIEAFATQLTRLELGEHMHLNNFGQDTDCSCLQQLGVNADALKVVKLGCDCSNDDMMLLMKLPNLETLWLQGLKYLPDQDWSNHACSWQELHIKYLGQFRVLGDLSLSGLKKLTTGSNMVSTALLCECWVQLVCCCFCVEHYTLGTPA